MGFFVFALLLLVIGLVTTFLGFRYSRAHRGENDGSPEFSGRITGFIGVAVAVLGLALVVPSTFYTQDAGEAKVTVSWTGELIGQTTTPGVHFKAPWVEVRTFDVRNNLVAYVGDGSANYAGNATTGPQITFQDKEGVTGNMDLTVRYSINGDSVLDIYREYQTQDAFVSKVISETVRSEARKATSTRTTIQVYNDRAGLALDIQKALEGKLSSQGVTVEDVNLQEIRYSSDVVARFDEAQSARIAVDKAKAEQEAATVQAQTKVIAAQGDADANAILTESLTPEVLTQRYIDAMKTGTVFVVPEGSSPLITLGQ